jgi:hypothetical protein
MPRKPRMIGRKHKQIRRSAPLGGKPITSPSAELAHEELERDLDEIRRMGLVDRAVQEFNARVPQAQIEAIQIGYFGDRRIVWCDLSYRLHGTDDVQTKGFGFDKLSGADWKLNWPEKKLSPLTPLPAFGKLGAFRLRSPKVVVTDPGYDEHTASIAGLGCFIAPCAVGAWRVGMAKDSTLEKPRKMPRALRLIHESYQSPPAGSEGWQRVGTGVGGDSGLIVACDFAHFHDASLVPAGQNWTFDDAPADPNDLWYSFVCERIQRKMAVIIPHGVVVHWDGGMDLDVSQSGGHVCAIRLSISGWPNDI